jgi:hypothetical protein
MSATYYKKIVLNEIKSHGLIDSAIVNSCDKSEHIVASITLQHPYDDKYLLDFSFIYEEDGGTTVYICAGHKTHGVFPMLNIDESNIASLFNKLMVWIKDVFSREFISHGIYDLEIHDLDVSGVICDYQTQIESLADTYEIKDYNQGDIVSFDVSLCGASYTIKINITNQYHWCHIFIEDYEMFYFTTLKVNLEDLLKILYSARQIREAKLKQLTN